MGVSEVFRLTEFVVVTPCAAHDGQPAFSMGDVRNLGRKRLARRLRRRAISEGFHQFAVEAHRRLFSAPNMTMQAGGGAPRLVAVIGR